MVREEVIHISKDKKHDRHEVKIFRDKTLDHLHLNGVQIEEIIEWTDNASNQYKSCGAFLEMTRQKQPMTHNFFGTQHGKSPSDRAGAYYKNFVRKTVNSCKVVLLDCDDLARFSQLNYEKQGRCGQNSLCTHKRAGKHPAHYLKKVIYTPVIKRKGNKGEKTLPGTHNVFSVRNTRIRNNRVVESRKFFCVVVVPAYLVLGIVSSNYILTIGN